MCFLQAVRGNGLVSVDPVLKDPEQDFFRQKKLKSNAWTSRRLF